MIHCFECNNPDNIVNHHVVPQSFGGTKTVPLCQLCHDKVHQLKPRNISLSTLIKNGMQKYKQQNPHFKFGNKNIREVRKLGVTKNKEKSDNHKDIFRSVAHYYRNNNYTLKRISEIFNNQNLKTRYNKSWNEVSVYRLLKSPPIPSITNHVKT